jgi:hypothetical protein
MPAGDMVQKGTTVVVGFNGVTFGTWIMEDSSEAPGADIKEIRGANNSVVTKLISNPHVTYELTGIILSADLTTARAALIGGTVSVNSVSCMIQSLKLSYNREDAKCTMTVIKEAGMTYA